MRDTIDSWLDRLLLRRARSRWHGVAERAAGLDPAGRDALRCAARALRRELDRVLRVAEGRLAPPAAASGEIPGPRMADWVWRPEIWREPIAPAGIAEVESGTRMGSEATIFHDCALMEIAARQMPNPGGRARAPFAWSLEVFGFEGSFLSLALDLPDEAVAGLTRGHVVRLDAPVSMERPIKIFARLNVRHGPNTEQIVRELPLTPDGATVEFDLAYSKMNEKRVERAWLDLIFDGPAMNRIALGDLAMSRRPRAEI